VCELEDDAAIELLLNAVCLTPASCEFSHLAHKIVSDLRNLTILVNGASALTAWRKYSIQNL
jgi:hypothetical protein